MAETLSDVLNEQLPLIDRLMAACELEPLYRPLAAAMFFVEKCITRINGDTKDDYLNKPWFAEIYQEVQRWYVRRYGARLAETPRAIATGLVQFLGTFFKIEIPLVTGEQAEDPMKKWIVFPDSVLPNENPIEWLTAPPNLAALNLGDRTELEQKVRWVVSSTRALTRDFSSAILAEPDYKHLASDVPVHLSAGATHVLERGGTWRLAVWEWHLAVEKSFKVFLRQRNAETPNTHDLNDLCRRAEDSGLPGLDRELLNIMPSSQDAVGYRYGKGKSLTQAKLAEIYRSALIFSGTCGAHLDRNLKIRRLRVLIQVLPWARPVSDRKSAC